MRVRVRHEITHRFEPAARHAIATLRMTPRSHVGQHILRWTLDVTPDCRLMPEEDAFGNTVHTFSVGGPVEAITVIAEGDVDTQDTTGIIAGTAERFPPSLFLRQTDLTLADEAIIALSARIGTKASAPLDRLHALMVAIHDSAAEIAPGEGVETLAAGKTLAAKKGTAASLAHVFISAARHLRMPARQVSGYAALEEVPAAFREWAEAHVPGIGWVGFDCGKNICPSDGYVRLAVGLDSLAVAPMLSTGSQAENTAVARDFFQSSKSEQSQKQGRGQRQE